MKPIEIDKIEKYSSFVTRNGKQAKFIKYVPEANSQTRLLFLVDEKVLGCDTTGKCWVINGVDSSFTDSRYYGFDIFVDNKIVGWINLNASTKLKNPNVLAECSSLIYKTYEEAIKNATEKTFKTLKIEWSINDEPN